MPDDAGGRGSAVPPGCDGAGPGALWGGYRCVPGSWCWSRKPMGAWPGAWRRRTDSIRITMIARNGITANHEPWP